MDTVAESILIIITILIIGFIGEIIARRLKTPFYLWLLILGIILGPILHLFPQQGITYNGIVTEIIATLVIYNIGLNVDLNKLLRNKRLIYLSAVEYITTVLFVFIILYLVGFGIYFSLVVAIALANVELYGVSIVKKGRGSEDIRINALLTQIFSIVVLFGILAAGQNTPSYTIVEYAIAEFSIGLVIGLLSGLIWLPLQYLIRKVRFNYASSLAVMFLVYFIASRVGGSAPLSVLVFGIVEANGNIFYKALEIKKKIEIDRMFREINDLLSFIAISFFFVYIGSYYSITYQLLMVSIIISIELIMLRIIVGNAYGLSKGVGYYSSRGVLTAILASFIPLSGFSYLVMYLIVTVVIITTVSTSILENYVGS